MTPTPDQGAAYYKTRAELLKAALRVIDGFIDEDEYAHKADEAQYASEGLAIAARAHAEAVEALPRDKHPVGWHSRAEEKPHTVRADDADPFEQLQPIIKPGDLPVIPPNKMPTAWDNILGRPTQP